MELRIRPEPEQRDAVEAAVEALLKGETLPPVYTSAWRLRAIRENAGDGYGETVRPRRTPGATRA